MKAARGDIIALLDADCAAASDWISTIERELRAAPPEVAGVQGVTELSPGLLSREVTALLYGMRSGPRDHTAARLVTDNVAFRRDVMRRFAFEHPSFGTVVDSLLLHRLRRAGYRMVLCERMRMIHSYPGALPASVPWFFLRAWAVGYFMVRTRQLERDVPGSVLVRAAGLGWPCWRSRSSGAMSPRYGNTGAAWAPDSSPPSRCSPHSRRRSSSAASAPFSSSPLPACRSWTEPQRPPPRPASASRLPGERARIDRPVPEPLGVHRRANEGDAHLVGRPLAPADIARRRAGVPAIGDGVVVDGASTSIRVPPGSGTGVRNVYAPCQWKSQSSM